MTLAPQERLALSTLALLLGLGGVMRGLAPKPSAAVWEGTPGAELQGSGLPERVETEVAREERRHTPLSAGERLDPNSASADELDRLPRVGPALAERIVAWRAEHGRFRTLAQLDSVPGIGPSTLEGLAPHLALPPAPAARHPAREPAPLAPAPSADGPLDLNRATAAELETLPRIGPALAARIVAFRQEHGPFRSVAELEQVSGIGPRMLEQLTPRLRVAH